MRDASWDMIMDDIVNEVMDLYPGNQIIIRDYTVAEASDRAAHEMTDNYGPNDKFIDVEVIAHIGTEHMVDVKMTVWLNVDSEMVRAIRVISHTPF